MPVFIDNKKKKDDTPVVFFLQGDDESKWKPKYYQIGDTRGNVKVPNNGMAVPKIIWDAILKETKSQLSELKSVKSHKFGCDGNTARNAYAKVCDHFAEEIPEQSQIFRSIAITLRLLATEADKKNVNIFWRHTDLV
jgi:hypothetical protein